MENSKVFKGLIIKAISGFFYVYCNLKTYECRAPKKIRFKDEFVKPVAGDYVLFTKETDLKGNIISIEPRKNYFIRPNVANVNNVVIVQSLVNPNLSTLLLDKYLAFFEARLVDQIFIAFSKYSLLKDTKESDDVINGYLKDGYKVFDIEKSYHELSKHLKQGITVITGQTGAGKSTLLNKIDPDFKRISQEVSIALGRGKHTTTEVQLLKFGEGFLADSPGFSNISLNLTKEELAKSFHDFYLLSQKCKFRNCLHIKERECAVQNAYKNNMISAWRYINYLKLQGEIENDQ